MSQSNREKLDAADYALIGAGVGAAGVGNSAGLIGLATTLSLMPVCAVAGAILGLLLWGIKSLADKS